MNIILRTVGSFCIAEIESDDIVLYDAQSALDIIGNCGYQGAEHIILHASAIHPDFFELKNGIAGEILQKFSNYRASLAIVGDFTSYTSKSLADFIYESNKTGRINFVSSTEEAMDALLRKKS